jgi:hypothetical protein
VVRPHLDCRYSRFEKRLESPKEDVENRIKLPEFRAFAELSRALVEAGYRCASP